jgi:hypothetical protein
MQFECWLACLPAHPWAPAGRATDWFLGTSKNGFLGTSRNPLWSSVDLAKLRAPEFGGFWAPAEITTLAASTSAQRRIPTSDEPKLTATGPGWPREGSGALSIATYWDTRRQFRAFEPRPSRLNRLWQFCKADASITPHLKVRAAATSRDTTPPDTISHHPLRLMADPAPPKIDRVVRLTCTVEGRGSRAKELPPVQVHSASTHQQVLRNIKNSVACNPSDTVMLTVDHAIVDVEELVQLAIQFVMSGELPTALPGTIQGLRAMVTVCVTVTAAFSQEGSFVPSSDETVAGEKQPSNPAYKTLREARPLGLRRDVGLRR